MSLFCFVSPNTFLTLPPVKQFYNHFKNDNEVLVIQSTILEYDEFFDNPSTYFKVNKYSKYKSYNKQSKGDKFKKFLKFTLLYIFRLKLFNKSDQARVIYSCELYPLFLSLLLKQRSEKILYHQFEVLNKNLNPIDRFCFWYIKRNFRKVSLAIFPEENRRNHFLENVKEFKKKQVFLLPNTNNNSPILAAPPLNHEKINITHIGAVGLSHNIVHFMEAISQLNENRYEVRFIGRLTSDVKELIKKYNCAHVKIIGQIKHSELKKYYLDTDIGVILYKDVSINHRYCAPNKLYEYWSYGIPVLGDKLPGLISVFKDKSLGQLVDMRKTKNIVEAIKSFNSEQYKKSYIQHYFVENYKLDNYLNALEKKLTE